MLLVIKWHLDERMVLSRKQKQERRWRDAALADESGHNFISLWGDFIEEIKEFTQCEITNIAMANVNGLKLSTTTMSSFKPSTETI